MIKVISTPQDGIMKMLLDKFEQEGLLFNVKFKSATSNAGTYSFRGELILVEGEIADDQGRRKPPVAILRHAVLMEQNGKLAMSVGFMDNLELLKTFVEKYRYFHRFRRYHDSRICLNGNSNNII